MHGFLMAKLSKRLRAPGVPDALPRPLRLSLRRSLSAPFLIRVTGDLGASVTAPTPPPGAQGVVGSQNSDTTSSRNYGPFPGSRGGDPS